MRGIIGLVMGLMLLVSTSGCSMFSGNSASIANEEVTAQPDLFLLDADSENILEEGFMESEVAWDADRVAKIKSYRSSIAAMASYLKNRLINDSSLPYYESVAGFSFTQNQYNLLQAELDARILIPNAVDKRVIIIYKYVVRDIQARLAYHQDRISASEKSIKDKASKQSISDLKTLYKTIEPLVKLVI